MRSFPRIGFALCAALLCCAWSAKGIFAQTVLDGQDRIDLVPYFQYTKETPELAALSPQKISEYSGWVSSGGRELDFGFTRDAYWFKAQLRAAKPGRYVLMVDAAASDLKLYTRGAAGEHFFDLSLEARGRPDVIRYRRPAVELDLPAGDTEILLRLQNEQLSRMAPILFTSPAFHEFRMEESLIYGAFFGAILAVALYNFFVFLSTREVSYGIYVVYALAAGAYTAGFQGFHIAAFPGMGRYWLLHSVPVSTALVGVGMNLFAKNFLHTRTHAPFMDKIHIALAVCSGLIAAAGALPVPRIAPILNLLAVFAALSVTSMLLSGILVWRTGYAPARYYVLAISVLGVAAVASSLRLLGFLEHRFWIQHGVQAGILAEMILLSLALSDRINFLKKSLERHLKQIALAHDLVAASEKKYRVLVEDTSDLIFSLDITGVILSMNHAASRILGYSPRSMAGQSIFSFLFDSGRESPGYDLILFRDRFEKLGQEVLQTRLRFASKQGEPVNLIVRLERIGSIGGSEEAIVLGKASLHAEDVLLPALVTEHGSYSLENFLNVSDLVHQRITRSLGRYFDQDIQDDIALVLREMLMNAIEHGNLEISYAEKTAAQAQGTYLELIQKRQKLDPYRKRRVFVEYSLNAKRAWFRITDEGRGFDHRAMQEREKDRLKDMAASHGRGIALARALFDVVRYNDAGNSVVLAKLTRAPSQTPENA